MLAPPETLQALASALLARPLVVHAGSIDLQLLQRMARHGEEAVGPLKRVAALGVADEVLEPLLDETEPSAAEAEEGEQPRVDLDVFDTQVGYQYD